jgi:hypothetical protein
MEDGVHLAYVTTDGGLSHVRRQRADGSSPRPDTVLALEEEVVHEVLFARDDRLLFRVGNQDAGLADIGIADSTGHDLEDQTLSTEFNERAIDLSPDGGLLAYVSDPNDRDEVFVRPYPDLGSGQVQVSVDGGTEPIWSPRGRELFFRASDGWMTSVALGDGPMPQVLARERLFDAEAFFRRTSWRAYDVAHDGQHFFMIQDLAFVDPEESLQFVLIQNWFTELEERLGGDR